MQILAYDYFKKLDHISVILQMCWVVEFPIANIMNPMISMIFNGNSISCVLF